LINVIAAQLRKQNQGNIPINAQQCHLMVHALHGMQYKVILPQQQALNAIAVPMD
jgi:hypothetical protein